MGRGGNMTNNPSNLRSTPGVGLMAQDHTGPFHAEILVVFWPKPGQAEPGNTYTIVKGRHGETGEEVGLVGNFGPVEPGAEIEVEEYSWQDHPKFGMQIRVWKVAQNDPRTKDAIIDYLQNLDGVGPATAVAIYEKLGSDCLEKLDANPALLLDVQVGTHSLDSDNLDALAAQWESLREDRKARIFLSSIGLSDKAAVNAIEYFGPDLVQAVVLSDPYRLCEVEGVRFKTADSIALKNGLAFNDPRRTGAGIEYLLSISERSGHICLTEEEIFQDAPRLLERNGKQVDIRTLNKGFRYMLESGRLYKEASPIDGVDRVYTREHFNIETRLYQCMEERLTARPLKPPRDLIKPADSMISDEQWDATVKAFSEKFSIITGSAGSGKTTAVKNMLDEFDKRGVKYRCIAPTGKAAKRMNESTGRKATTIHRALGMDGLRAPYNIEVTEAEKENAIFQEEVIIVDETSMVDMRLAERVLTHTSPDSRIVFIGDPNQLPAIGAGSVLFDLIESGRVPTTRLTTIFRQAESSLLVVNANRISRGEEPYWTAEAAEAALGHSVKRDWEFIETKDSRTAVQKIRDLNASLPADMGLVPDDLLVTNGRKKGNSGVFALNKVLQEDRNPSGDQIRQGEEPLRVGDVIMNTENQYRLATKDEGQLDVMNGDQGKIVSYNPTNKSMVLNFEGKEVVFSGDQIAKVIPAYAATTHKLQGSEAPVVIAPTVGEDNRLMTRNMLYTAWTRGKEKCFVIGDKELIGKAIERDGTKRKTTLDLRVGTIAERIKTRWELSKEPLDIPEAAKKSPRNFLLR